MSNLAIVKRMNVVQSLLIKAKLCFNQSLIHCRVVLCCRDEIAISATAVTTSSRSLFFYDKPVDTIDIFIEVSSFSLAMDSIPILVFCLIITSDMSDLDVAVSNLNEWRALARHQTATPEYLELATATHSSYRQNCQRRNMLSR